ncbi:MAG TPA: TIGR03435 family protein [Bryobacteraceae bacterium]|jgi:uncharacterized protein (TIGR03435 family)
MMRAFAGLSVLVSLSAVVSGQNITAAAAPAFEIADVHVSSKTVNPYMSGGVLRGSRYEIRRATMVDLIRLAYGLDDPIMVQGGPSWLDLDRFDVIAKAPAGATQDSAKLMLQTLLADRFKLVVHMGTKPLPTFVLALGKGKPKIKESDGKSAPGCQPPPNQPPQTPGVYRNAEIQCRNISMDVFAPTIRGMAGAYLGDHPVVNQTGLEGAWDFDVVWTAKQMLAALGAEGISIFDAVDKQLGLKIDLQQVPTPVIQVDSANEKPTPNPPGVVTALPPPPPAEFEVADIKPSLPDANPGGQGLMPGGRIDIRGYPLKILIQVAWDINNPDELMAGAPKFVDSAKFDIIAKASSITSGPATAQQIDIDDLRVMFQALLIDRFKMKVHYEDRPVNGYVITNPGKPKLTKADPSNRTGCHEGPGADGKDPRIANPILSRLLTCQNMTIAQFADQLPNLANGYAHTPVLDSTGLTDPYDFTLSFSSIGALQNGLPSVNGEKASDPSGGLSLPDAINKQLGLKMDMQKRPMQVLVIDHVEEKPTDN